MGNVNNYTLSTLEMLNFILVFKGDMVEPLQVPWSSMGACTVGHTSGLFKTSGSLRTAFLDFRSHNSSISVINYSNTLILYCDTLVMDDFNTKKG
jgi:hypothetical protein